MKTKIHFSKLYQLLEGRFRDVPHGFAVRTLIFCARRLYGFSAGFAKTHIENVGIFVLPEALGGPGGGREVAGRAGRAPGGPREGSGGPLGVQFYIKKSKTPDQPLQRRHIII